MRVFLSDLDRGRNRLTDRKLNRPIVCHYHGELKFRRRFHERKLLVFRKAERSFKCILCMSVHS